MALPEKSSSVSVGRLYDEFSEVLKQWQSVVDLGASSSQSAPPPSICVEDLRFSLPHERIEQAIQANVEATKTGERKIPIPKYQDLIDEPKNSGISVFVEPDAKKRKVGKTINYLSDSRVEKEHEGFEQVDAKEVVLKVSFFHSEKDAKMAQYMVLGSQPLTDLRDRFYCLADHILDGPETRSSFMFIENVFYNDMRSAKAMDYSRVIMDWTNENERYKDPGVGMGMTAARMQDVTFDDLDIVIGAQYLLCHQGSCEHIMVFDEVRLLQDEDCQNANAYPLQLYEGCHIVRKCHICKIASAKKVTYGDTLAPESPCFFCEQCYHQLHYTKDEAGEFWKLAYDDFEVYPYFHE